MGQMEPQFEQVGKAFIQHYYQAFDTNRANLGDLYQAESMSAPFPFEAMPLHFFAQCNGDLMSSRSTAVVLTEAGGQVVV